MPKGPQLSLSYDNTTDELTDMQFLQEGQSVIIKVL